MATVFMVRHASHALLDRVLRAGTSILRWMKVAAEGVSQTLETQLITHIHSSPRRRAQQTASALGRRLGLQIEIAPWLDEVVGHWAGRAFRSAPCFVGEME